MMLYKWRHHQRGAESWEPELSFSRKNQSTAPRDYLTREERSKIRDASLEYGSVPSRENVRGEERDRWEAYLAQRFEKPRITADGFEQLGQIGNPDMIPNWTLDPETVDAEDLPWWVPDDTLVAPTVTCEGCGSDVSVREVVTPQRPGVTNDSDVLCRDCWQEYR